MPSSDSTLQTLRETTEQIELVDTHEHLLTEEEWIQRDERITDFSVFFLHYASVDVISAGMPQADMDAIRGPNLSLDEKWEKFEPYWLKARNTAYCKAVDRAIKDLYGLDGLSRETYRELKTRMMESQKPGWYRFVLKDKARIDKSIRNAGEQYDVDREFFLPVMQFDNLIMARSRAEIAQIERQANVSIHSLDDFLQALDLLFQRGLDGRVVATKCAVAYQRVLNFEFVSKAEAETAFARIFKAPAWSARDANNALTASEAKPLSDFVFHQILRRTIDAGLPMQIHTGIQEGNGNYLAWTNPIYLSSVFMMYPEGRFDLFHAGYPYWQELGVLAKMFQGVYADLCWANVISPVGSRRALSEWLEVMPASKIFGFGGDYIFIEGAYAHAMIARDNVARVLAQKVDEGYFSLDEAKRVAHMVLRDNAKEFFRI